MERPSFVPHDIYFSEPSFLEQHQFLQVIKRYTISRLPERIKQPLREIRGAVRRKHQQSVSVGDVTVQHRILGEAGAHYFLPGYEQEFGHTLIQVFQQQEHTGVFYDVGAAEGLYSLFADQIGLRVVAFEPDEELATDLFINLLVNNPSPDDIEMESVFLYSAAVGNENKQVTFHTAGRNGWAPSLEKTNTSHREVTVPMVTLDSFIRVHELPFPTVIKIDVEGAELMVLEGASQLLQSENRPHDVFVEIHDQYLKRFFSTNSETVWNTITGYGYLPRKVFQRGDQLLCHFSVR